MMKRSLSVKIAVEPEVSIEERADVWACWEALGLQDDDVLQLKHLQAAADKAIGSNNYNVGQLKRALLQMSQGPVGWDEFKAFMMQSCGGNAISADQVIKTVTPGGHGTKLGSHSGPKPAATGSRSTPASLIMITDTWRLLDLLHATKRRYMMENVCTPNGQGMNARKWYESAAEDEAAERQRQVQATSMLSRALSIRKSMDMPNSPSGTLSPGKMPSRQMGGSGSLGHAAAASPTTRSPMYGRRRASLYMGQASMDTLEEDLMKLKTGSFESKSSSLSGVTSSVQQRQPPQAQLTQSVEVTSLPTSFGAGYIPTKPLMTDGSQTLGKRESISSVMSDVSNKASVDGGKPKGAISKRVSRDDSSRLLAGVQETLAAAGISTDKSISHPSDHHDDGYVLGKRRSSQPAAAASPAPDPLATKVSIKVPSGKGNDPSSAAHAEGSNALLAWIHKSHGQPAQPAPTS